MNTTSLRSAEAEREELQLERAERALVKVRWLGLASWLFALQRIELSVAPVWPYAVLAVSVGYTAVAEWRIRRGHYVRRTAALTTLGDSIICTLICLFTGGIRSPLVPYFYFTVLAGSVRFGSRQTFLVWILNTACSVLVYVAAPGPPAALGDLVLEVFYMGFTAFMGSMLSHEVMQHYRHALREGDKAGLLLSVNRQITSTLDLSQVLERILHEAAHAIPCRKAAIVLLDRSHERVERVLVAGGFTELREEPLERSLREGLLRDAREQGGLVWNDVAARRQRLAGEPVGELLSQNLALIPIQRRADLGFLVAVDKQGPDAFGDEERGLLSAVADQAAVAIENARLVEDVLEARDRTQELLRRLISAEEAERKRIAGEIHDRMGARFFEFYYALRRCQERLGERDPTAAELLRKLSGEAQQFSDEIRSLMNDLRPTVLDDFGFTEALREYVAALEAQGDLVVSLKIDEAARPRDPEVNVMLFRVLQEAVLNVRKHAQAERLSVELAANAGNEVRLSIHDDGVGFEPGTSPRGHYGLLHMKERAEACGGTLAIQSRPRHGTEVRVTVGAGEGP